MMNARSNKARNPVLRWLGAGAVAALTVLGAPAPASEPDQIAVVLDQAKLLKLPAGTATIIVGNPAIADVNIQRNGVLVITGRSPGRTNFIALDGDGTIITESMVSVSAARGGALVVQRGLDQASYHCAPNCQPAIVLGDEEKHFGRALDQPSRRESAANQGGAAQQQRR